MSQTINQGDGSHVDDTPNSQSADPHLRPDQLHEAEERSSPPASVVHEAIRREGEGELKRPLSAVAWSGLAAGLSMGFSFMTEALLQANLPDTPGRMLIVRLGYTVGYVVVILGRQQLFTENTLTPILPFLTNATVQMLIKVLRLWAVVLVSNLVGAFAFSWIISHTTLFEPQVLAAMTSLSAEVIDGSFFTILLQGIFAGWLIALIVWLLPFAEAAHIYTIILVSYVVGLGGFAHIVAGSVETFYAVNTGALSVGDYFTRFMIPAFIGNAIGGVSLVALLGHAQVVAGKAGPNE